MAARHEQVCGSCGEQVELLFSPPTVFITPEAFKHSYSEMFGTTSEKDYLRANPNLEIMSHSRTPMTDRKRKADERKKIIEEGKDVERVLIGRGQLKKYNVEAGSMTSDV